MNRLSESISNFVRRKTEHGKLQSPARSSRDASLALDEATQDLLRLSSQPPSAWYSSSSYPLHVAGHIPKSASTTSMNKVIRTKVITISL